MPSPALHILERTEREASELLDKVHRSMKSKHGYTPDRIKEFADKRVHISNA